MGNGTNSPAEGKIESVDTFPISRTKSLRAFVGLARYYDRYRHHFSVIAVPLTDEL